MAGTKAIKDPHDRQQWMFGNARGENEMVRPGTSRARAIAMATNATSPEPATIHSGCRHGWGR